MKQSWIILGATSSIAKAFVRKLAIQGDTLFLAGRDAEDLARISADCLMRGAAIAEAFLVDLRDPGTFAAVLDRAEKEEGQINAAVFAGSMPPQSEIDADPALIDGVVADSFTGPAQFLQRLAPLIEQRECGVIVGTGSVAGDRGRLGNYVYGAAKAGFHTYLSGLRNRLGRAGGHVVTVKPGMIDTAMTWGLDGLVLVASPDKVADDILKAVRTKRNTVYSHFIWRYVMLVIRCIPEPIFKKLSI